MRLKIASEQVSFAENIGEWRERVKLLSASAGLMKKAWHAARQLFHSASSRKRFTGNLKQILGKDWKPKTPFEWGDVASTHLAITYGVRPLIGQLEDVLDQLNRVKMARKRIQVTLSSTAQSRTSRTGYDGEIRREGEQSQRVVCYVTFNKNAADFTAGNLASSIWAGTKLSFMVDWMVDIGGYLESLTALTAVDSLCGTISTHTNGSVTNTQVQPGRILLRPGTYQYRSTSRSVFNSISLPPKVNIRFGDDPGSNGWDQLVSAMEIFTQLRRGKTSFFGD